MVEIILGSQSPRRRELMAGLDLPFTAISIDADEHYPAELQGGDIPYYISRAKARAYVSQLKEDQLLITADTIVWLDGKMLGKPHDEADAIDMLRRLSGKTHQVFTGVSFAKIGTTGSRDLEITTIVDRTDVTFKDLTDEEINYYVQKYRPFDKAGAYGVQEWIGYIACTEMKGSYFNVMGFPVHQVYKVLKQML
jgi:septum formation protein